MFTPEFITYITDTIPVGNRMFANDVRRFVYAHNNEYYQLVNFEDDEVFLDSLLISCFLNEKKETTLDQILFKHLPEERLKEVKADDKGRVYVPGLGYFLTSYPHETLWIKAESPSYALYKAEERIDFKFIPVKYIPETSIEIAPFKLPYSNELFNEINPKNPEIEVEEITKQHEDKVVTAFRMLKEHFPEFYQWLMLSMKKIQVFKNPEIWSFAAVRLYGNSYLSAHEKRSVLFFLEDILHQCAHNLFFAVTYFERKELFNISPEENLDSFAQNGDHRDIYGVFHGLFTQSCISIFFDTCLEKNLFTGKEKLEVIGRLSDNMKRWTKMIELFSQEGIFTEMGEQFYFEFKRIYEEMHQKYHKLIYDFDTSNQPYIFCFDKFYEANADKLEEEYV